MRGGDISARIWLDIRMMPHAEGSAVFDAQGVGGPGKSTTTRTPRWAASVRTRVIRSSGKKYGFVM